MSTEAELWRQSGPTRVRANQIHLMSVIFSVKIESYSTLQPIVRMLAPPVGVNVLGDTDEIKNHHMCDTYQTLATKSSMYTSNSAIS